VNMLIKSQSKFAEHGKTESEDAQRESTQRSAAAIYVEIGIALAAALGLLAMAARIWQLASLDWISSIQWFQERI
jgi:hypothetical protein